MTQHLKLAHDTCKLSSSLRALSSTHDLGSYPVALPALDTVWGGGGGGGAVSGSRQTSRFKSAAK